VPFLITENGVDDLPGEGLHDHFRIAYHAQYLDAVRTAMAAGVDVRAYFVWSLLDNWEWSDGFKRRFGLFAVDDDPTELRPPTLTRVAKESVGWLRSAIRQWPGR
tara:strand:- start:187 stop:501 length:315 start_codon:yes stop_codon:yes gene_type:complete